MKSFPENWGFVSVDKYRMRFTHTFINIDDPRNEMLIYFTWKTCLLILFDDKTILLQIFSLIVHVHRTVESLRFKVLLTV